MLKAPQRSSAITGSACHSNSQPFVRIKLSVFLLHVSMEPSVLPLPIFLYSLTLIPAIQHHIRISSQFFIPLFTALPVDLSSAYRSQISALKLRQMLQKIFSLTAAESLPALHTEAAISDSGSPPAYRPRRSISPHYRNSVPDRYS